VAAVAAVLLAAVASGCDIGSSSPHTADLRTPSCPTKPYPQPDDARPRYRVHLRIDPGRRTVTGTQAVEFTPDLPTDRIVLRLWANSPVTAREGAGMRLGTVRVDGARARLRLSDPTTAVVRHPVAAGETVTLATTFHLRLPRAIADRISQRGDAIRLGSFVPLLPWVPGEGWALDAPTRIPSEASVSPVADFDVTITTPSGLDVVASGVEASPGHWQARAVRDFAVATGDFRYARTSVKAPDDRVTVTAAVARGVPVDPQKAADEAASALAHMAKLYGPYPFPQYTIAFGPDLQNEGIEYPTLVFEGPDTRSLVTAHEAAHQWFYSLVGNNQAREPWLDEALASWAGAEAGNDMELFQTVPVPQVAGGRLGAPMTFWDRHGQAYFPGVYAQGVQALNTLGTPQQIGCALRRYVAANAYRIATTKDVLAAFSSVLVGAEVDLARYGIPPPT
jgi:aminopeptidase N